MIIEASVMEWSLAIIGIIGSLAGLLKASKCTKIKCGITGLECERKNDLELPPVQEIKKENKEEGDDFSRAMRD
tara:strand:+ start:448 stop:669 length:222 start_codon:yes stop_codon:yes gene_type:complete